MGAQGMEECRGVTQPEPPYPILTLTEAKTHPDFEKKR